MELPESTSGTSSLKQVIVIRKDLKMRRGKEIAQGAHASWLAVLGVCSLNIGQLELIPPVMDWLLSNYKKICVTCSSAEELLELAEKAHYLGLPCAVVYDEGLTEFKGVRTATALGIGPAESGVIDQITGHLPLY